MSIQEKNVNTLEKKDRWIQIRVSDSEKDRIEAKAKSSNCKNVSQYILDRVLTDNVNTNHINVNTLKECILEFNKLMGYNAENILFPRDFDKNKIIKGVNECRLI